MLSFQRIMRAGADDDNAKKNPRLFLVPDNGGAIFKGSFIFVFV